MKQSVLMLSLCCVLAACHQSGSRSMGYVLSSFDHLFYTAEGGKEECPEGYVHSSKENWHVQFPTLAARKAQFQRCGAIDNRGPACENVLAAPESVRDPLPYREVKGAKAYGSNLDGTEDGRATGTTCAHGKFVNPDGTPGVDNQYYRLLGCQKIVHPGGLLAPGVAVETVRQHVATRPVRILMEIREVDDEENDEHVEVVIYRGKDPLAVDAQGNAVPWQSQRIDEDSRPQHLRGRIVKGELITEPADLTLNIGSFFVERPYRVRGAQLRLRLTESGAGGLRTGYVDAASWWRARRSTTLMGSFTGDSPPALHAALHRLADGYKDPNTGACTALSSAMKLEFVRAYIRHPAGGTQ